MLQPNGGVQVVDRCMDVDSRRKIWPGFVDLGDVGTCLVIEVMRVDEITQRQYVWKEEKMI